MAEKEQLPVVDRSRITHKQSKRMSVAAMELQRAQRDLDAERVAALMEEVDAMMMAVVVSVPAGWLPDGVSLSDSDWIDHLTQDKYEALAAAARPAAPGEKKG
jgi:hypothetical protein